MPNGGKTAALPVKVLYIDDEPSLLESTRHYLERRGNFSVDTVTSAKGGLELLEKNTYDVIVSDYQMPVMDGIELLRYLREQNNLIPFIIFTGKGHEDVVVEAYNAGADFYIPKGGNPKAMFLDLTQKITQIVTRRRSEIALSESEERYRKVVEQSHDAIFIYRNSRLVFVNNQVGKMTGYTKDELLKMDIWDIIHTDDHAILQDIFPEGSQETDPSKTYEIRLITKNREVRSLEIALSPLAFNGTASVLGSARDITERKTAEEALRKSEEKYRSIFNTFDDLYYQTEMNGIITILSPSCKKLTGWDPSELVGTQVLDLYPYPEQRKLLLEHMFENGAVHDYEVILLNKKGEHLNVSVTSHVVRNEKGEPVAIEGTLRDITERIRFENALFESEERFRTLADFLPVMIFETDLDGMLTFGNRMILPVFGIDPDAIGAKINVITYIVPEDRERAVENIKKMYAGIPRTSTEYTLIRKDGSRFPALISANPILDRKSGAPVGMRGAIIDLSERKEAERILQESEQYLKTIFNSVHTALVVVDPKTHTIHDLNPAAVNLIGEPRESLIGMPCRQALCPAREEHCPVTDLHMRVENREQIIITPSGRKIPVTKTIVPVTIAKKEYLLENIVDITDRKRAEDAVQKAFLELERKVDERTVELSRLTENLRHEIAERNRVMDALRVSEEKYRSLVDTSPDIIWEIDLSGKIRYINPIVTTVTGYTPEELAGRRITDLVPEHEQARIVSEVLAYRSVEGSLAPLEVPLLHQDGRHMVIEIRPSKITDPDGTVTGFRGVARDVTEMRAMQDEIAASLKEKEILLKEIHHRVKNNMQVISSLLSLQAKMVKDEKSRAAIMESQTRVMSIALVHERLYQSKSLARIDYGEYVQKMAETLFNSYNVRPDRVALDIDITDIILPISKAIPVSLIINELLSNSLKYAFLDDRKGTVGIIFKKEGDRHFLTVWDDGAGLPEGYQWDKAETLGLQLVVSLVGQLAGTIAFTGKKGTRFDIEFTIDSSAGE